VRFLQSDRLKGLKSFIVYTMFQSQADKVAFLLARKGFKSDSYHGGKSVKDRQTIQKRFMKGDIDVLVATIAFGLGVNKSDVRGVIHYSLPKSIENYVQEVGRAGRDDQPAFCHLLLSREDYVKQRCFSHSEGVEEASIWKLLLRVFCDTQQENRYNAVPLELLDIETTFDMSETQVTTLLQYIKLEGGGWIGDFGLFHADCKISFTRSLMTDLARTSPLVALICKTYPGTTRTSFDIDTLSACAN
jgi:ATP-dependent DNA helicase Q4